MKLRAIKIEVNTSVGLFGADYTFVNGLNIIRGNNSSGKSSLFQAIIYALGLEEILGGRNEKPLQFVFREYVEDNANVKRNVLQSAVYLEIENRDRIITARRSIVDNSRKPQLVEVFLGPQVTSPSGNYEVLPMYVHDSGGASNEYYGFHAYLAEYLGWDLPSVLNSKGDYSKLFIQQIASAFIVEQKAGWSDFLATIPYYSTKNVVARVIEFVLSLDVYENERAKQAILNSKQVLISKWGNLYAQFQRLTERSGGILNGVGANPFIVNNIGEVQVRYSHANKEVSLFNLINIYKSDLQKVSILRIPAVQEMAVENERKIVFLNEQLSYLSVNYDLIQNELNLDRSRLQEYRIQLKVIEDDLKKNKGALKVSQFGAEVNILTAMHVCPTCEQELNDSLLPINIEQQPMRIEDNINYLHAQEKMIKVYIDGQVKSIANKTSRLVSFESELSSIRLQIRQLKQELLQDGRTPSEAEIERRINLKRRIDFFERIQDEFVELTGQLSELSAEYQLILDKEKQLPADFFSLSDRNKLNDLSGSFIKFLKNFGYRSVGVDNVFISRENYLPHVKKFLPSALEKSYSIVFDSSASDFIRCIWSYYISLLDVAVKYNTNHPRFLVFDEPKQQDVAIANFNTFLKKLASYKNEQTIVFASFENSELAFQEATEGVEFTLHTIEHRLVKFVDNN